MRVSLFVLAVVIQSALIGCAAAPFERPSVETLTPFLENTNQMQHNDRAPFVLLWIDQPSIDALRKGTDAVYLFPVNTQYLNSAKKSAMLSPGEKAGLAAFTQKAFTASITANNLLKLSPANGSEANKLEIALLDVDPTDAWLEGGADVAGLFVPGAPIIEVTAGAAEAITSHAVGKGGVALAVKFKDKNSKLLAELYDKREDRMAILFNANDFTKFGNARENISELAKEFVELITTPSSVMLTPPSAFALLLW